MSLVRGGPRRRLTITTERTGERSAYPGLSRFLERKLTVPAGVAPSQVTTVIVIEPDGSVRDVPTRWAEVDGQAYAMVNSLTNSIYALVHHAAAFTDTAGHWAAEPIDDLGSRLIVSGHGDGTFAPDDPITRAEFAALLMKGLGLRPEEGPEEEQAPFSDVTAGDWYNRIAHTTVTCQLMTGYDDGTFRPDEQLTREQAMVVLARAMEMTGMWPRLQPAQEKAALAPYSDQADISPWAAEGVAAVVHAGIVTGKSAGELAPQSAVTRAEAAVMLQRLLRRSNLIE